MGAEKVALAITLITVSSLFVLPAALRVLLGPELPSYLLSIIMASVGIPMLGFGAYEMWKNVQANREARRARQKLEAIEQQTYGCIQPQVLDSFVVFPVRINKRGCQASSWVEMGEGAIVADLCAAVKVTGQPDTEGPLRRLCEATFRKELEVIIYCGGGTAGPTGLAVGVGREGFGPFLATTVAHSIKDAIQRGVKGY